ncbi:MAG: PDZ domain-containing protein, partial [Calditrichia bacterium]|nr:PDZ domain-containing protein [Calditrichia bacterium]
EAAGAVITQVQDDSPAEKAGIKNDDIVIAVDGDKIENANDLTTKIGMRKPDSKVKLTIIRDGKKKHISVTLGEFEEEQEISAKSSESKSIEKMGLTVKNITAELKNRYNIPSGTKGVVVVGVESGSMLNRFGVTAGDVIDKINRKRIKNIDDYKEAIESVKEGDPVVLFLNRGDRRFTISFEMPE